jgi:peptidyl-prolyl cis-trans isomerase D
VQGIGYEPELVGSIFGTLVNTTSAPITGKSAVYVVEVTAVDEVKPTGDFTQQKANIVRQASSAASGQSYNALKEDADVIDNRSDFY